MKGPMLQNWIPIKLLKDKDQVYCEWLDTGCHEFLEPFFEETISKCKGISHSHRKSVSNLTMLAEWSAQLDTIEPTAFIFHVSRCGSTLVSQMLSLVPSNIVLSEVPFFDHLLQAEMDEERKAELLKAAIRFYGAKKTPEKERLFIKTDSWHILFYRQLRSMFEKVPFIILYRHPAAVIRSQQKRRGIHSVPGLLQPELFGWNKAEVEKLSLDDYLLRVLEKYFETILAVVAQDPFSLVINYNEGPLNIIKKMATTIGFEIREKELRKMEERTLYHSKNPREIFSEETTGTRLPRHWERIAGHYQNLEAIRCDEPAPTGV